MKQNKPKVSLSQIDNLLLEVERFNPSLQERVLDLVNNPTQCPVAFGDTLLDELTEEFVRSITSESWRNRADYEQRRGDTIQCCSCFQDMSPSSSILCDCCWAEEDPETETDHTNDLSATYEDMGITFFCAGRVLYATNHFFTLR